MGVQVPLRAFKQHSYLVHTDSIYYAFGGVLCSAILRTILRSLMKSGGNMWAILIFDQVGAAIILATLFSFPEYSKLPTSTLVLLSLSGLFWTLAPIFEMQSHKYLDVAINEIFGTIRYLLLTGIGIVIFREDFGILAVLGAGLIVTSVTWNIDLGSVSFRRGSLFKLLSSIGAAVALTLDKTLTARMALHAIAINAFIIPGLVLAVVKRREILKIKHEITRMNGLLLVVPPLLAIMYSLYLRAFQDGKLSSVVAILQTTTVFTYLLGIIFLKERTDWRKRGMSALFCVGGAILVSLR